MLVKINYRLREAEDSVTMEGTIEEIREKWASFAAERGINTDNDSWSEVLSE